MHPKGHPLPASDEARHNEIPEHFERDKGRGDDARKRLQPASDPVEPDGNSYSYGDLGRGPERTEGSGDEDLTGDQAAHQDRGQSIAEAEARPR